MGPIYRKRYDIDPTSVDRFGRLRTSVMLRYAQQVAGEHCSILSLDYDSLLAKGMFFAVVRNRLQVTRTPRVGETITLETWPMPTTRTAYPRSTVAYDEKGNEVFRSVTLWVLMDIRSRSMILPSKSGIDVEGTLRGNELASPRSLLPKTLEKTLRRKVCFTDLDRNGHMNNARYLDWIDDLLPSSFHKDRPAMDVTLCYMNEAREGHTLDVTWDFDSNGDLLVDIHRQKEGDGFDRVFAAKLSYLANR